MARAIGSSTPSRTASPKPASPPILRLHNPSILTRARSARSEHVTSHSHGEGGRLAPFSMANHWLPFTPAHWFPFTPALTPVRRFHFGTAATRNRDAFARMLRQPFAHPDRPLSQSVIPERRILELAVRPTHCSPPASHSVSHENRQRTATSTGETQYHPSSAHNCL